MQRFTVVPTNGQFASLEELTATYDFQQPLVSLRVEESFTVCFQVDRVQTVRTCTVDEGFMEILFQCGTDDKQKRQTQSVVKSAIFCVRETQSIKVA